MKKILIIGTGGFGKEVAWLIERINEVKPTWKILGFLDDNVEKIGTEVYGYLVLGTTEYTKTMDRDNYVVCSIGSALIRKKVVEKLEEVKFATVIDPSAIIAKDVKIGEGSIICAGSIITVDIKIGNHVIVNLDCTIGHDTIIKDYVTLYPSVNISGNVVLEKCVQMGTGTQIIQGLNVGQNTIVGAGAVVIKDLPSNSVAVGSPAKVIKTLSNKIDKY